MSRSRIDWDRKLTLREFVSQALRYGAMVAVVGGLIGLVANIAFIEYTAQPVFCKTCHNMVPYYESWKTSSHNMVACVDCHYEPGLIEVVQGKFVALNQLVKYVTASEGTKPWAEISDASCMRSGCHSKRLLWGEIPFKRVKFNHRHHLLEARRGRRLRCTTCHSQIVQGSHLTVTTNTCFTCHFLESDESLDAGDCFTCHGPPEGELMVDGRPFVHDEWVDRGVACEKCHDQVTRGDGAVPRARCRSCHGEKEHIERYDDVPFIHENHVTDHKVECFECHNEIVHSLRPLPMPGEEDRPAEVSPDGLTHHVTSMKDKSECNQCHDMGHSLQERVFRGWADAEIEVMPSRMSQTRVSCQACHDALSDRKLDDLTKAQKIDTACQGCHGASFAGMLADWQSEITGALAKLEARDKDLRAAAASADLDGPRRRALTDQLDRGTSRIELVYEDGSMGAHNLPYIREILKAAEEDLNKAAEKLDRPATSLDWRPAIESDAGCTTSCHTEIEQMTTVQLPTREFAHAMHIEDLGLACTDCHSVRPHGTTPILETGGCASCHHADTEDGCDQCHKPQDTLFFGNGKGDLKMEPNLMAEVVGCGDCHAGLDEEGYKASTAAVEACVACHDEDYRELATQWKNDAAAKRHTAVATLRRARVILSDLPADSVGHGTGRPLVDRAAKVIDTVRIAGGIHNPDGATEVLDAVIDDLQAWNERWGMDASAR